MPIIKDDSFIEDNWVRVGDDDPLPRQGDVIVSAERFRKERDALLARGHKLGLSLDNAANPQDVADIVSDIHLVLLEVPAFTDGRAYSQARHLRQHLEFTGELRARGAIFADQAAFLKQVGFDSFETDSDQPLDVWKRAAASMSLAYQRGYDGPQSNRSA